MGYKETLNCLKPFFGLTGLCLFIYSQEPLALSAHGILKVTASSKIFWNHRVVPWGLQEFSKCLESQWWRLLLALPLPSLYSIY